MTSLKAVSIPFAMDYHTVIIGAGPTGLSCAYELAKAGKSVLLIEKRKKPGPKVCAGGITWSGMRGDIPSALIERSFPVQHVRTPWQKVVITSPVPLVSTISRENLGRWMLDRAVKMGARIQTARLTGLSDNSVITDSGEFHFNFLVGADGSNSTVRRLKKIPSKQFGIGINYFVPGNFPNMEWHLDTEMFGNGYAWVFPHSKSASVGVYATKGSIGVDRLKNNFHLWCNMRGITLEGSKLTAATINYDHRGWHFKNLFLAGDAAGLASPLTGEGIYPGIISGKEVARTILDKYHDKSLMVQLIKRHRTHLRLVALTQGNRIRCRLLTELAVFALRSGIIPFNKIEMTG